MAGHNCVLLSQMMMVMYKSYLHLEDGQCLEIAFQAHPRKQFWSGRRETGSGGGVGAGQL